MVNIFLTLFTSDRTDGMGNGQTRVRRVMKTLSLDRASYRLRHGESEQLRHCLSPQQVQLIKDTWNILKEDLAFIGGSIFKDFFETRQEIKMYFPKIVRISESNQLEWDIDRNMLQQHGLTVMQGIGAAVENLDDSRFLNGILFTVGQSHVNRHIKPNMLKKLWPSINRCFRRTLKEHYTEDAEEAWQLIFLYICAHMKNGMQNKAS